MRTKPRPRALVSEQSRREVLGCLSARRRRWLARLITRLPTGPPPGTVNTVSNMPGRWTKGSVYDNRRVLAETTLTGLLFTAGLYHREDRQIDDQSGNPICRYERLLKQ
jgi:hypothetical protein